MNRDEAPKVSESEKLADGQEIEIVGTAAVLPDHASKAIGQGISTDAGELLFIGKYEPFADTTVGSAVRVKGIVREKRLPMFEHPNDGSPASQGIPVPVGTDIETASLYFVIENPVWTIVQ